MVGKDTLENYSDCCLYSPESPLLQAAAVRSGYQALRLQGNTLHFVLAILSGNAIAVSRVLWSGSLMELFYPCSEISFLHDWVSLVPALLMLLGQVGEENVWMVLHASSVLQRSAHLGRWLSASPRDPLSLLFVISLGNLLS